MKHDGLVKSAFSPGFVIPEKVGIQCFQSVKNSWTPVFTGMTTFYEFIKHIKTKCMDLTGKG
ncbi:MAG: hypothetical protein A2V86_16515 [Deltaproteobacteria bacterium RBG_16_49_23]|nr:MAG: hypothetical protein A2V86_16515 [Deltaproteobacteria bacterium RBG_16_49_23]